MFDQSESSAQSVVVNVEAIDRRLKELAASASNGCGCSHDVYVQKFSAAVEREYKTLGHDRWSIVEPLARAFDYASPAEIEDEISASEAMGYCRHGIDRNCCPAGCGDVEDPMSLAEIEEETERLDRYSEEQTQVACQYIHQLSESVRQACGECDDRSVLSLSLTSRYSELFTDAVEQGFIYGFGSADIYEFSTVLETAKSLGYDASTLEGPVVGRSINQAPKENAGLGWLVPKLSRLQSRVISALH